MDCRNHGTVLALSSELARLPQLLALVVATIKVARVPGKVTGDGRSDTILTLRQLEREIDVLRRRLLAPFLPCATRLAVACARPVANVADNFADHRMFRHKFVRDNRVVHIVDILGLLALGAHVLGNRVFIAEYIVGAEVADVASRLFDQRLIRCESAFVKKSFVVKVGIF